MNQVLSKILVFLQREEPEHSLSDETFLEILRKTSTLSSCLKTEGFFSDDCSAKVNSLDKTLQNKFSDHGNEAIFDLIKTAIPLCDLEQGSFAISCSGLIGSGTTEDPLGSLADLGLVLILPNYPQVSIGLLGEDLSCLFNEGTPPSFKTGISHLIISGSMDETRFSGTPLKEENQQRNRTQPENTSIKEVQMGETHGRAIISVDLNEASFKNQFNYLANQTIKGKLELRNIDFELFVAFSDDCLLENSDSLGLIASFSNFSLQNIGISGRLCHFPLFSSKGENESHILEFKNISLEDLEISRSLMEFEGVSGTSFEGMTIKNLKTIRSTQLISLGSLASKNGFEVIHDLHDFSIEAFSTEPDKSHLDLIYFYQKTFGNFESTREFTELSVRLKMFSLNCSDLSISNSQSGFTFFKVFGFIENFFCSRITGRNISSLSGPTSSSSSSSDQTPPMPYSDGSSSDFDDSLSSKAGLESSDSFISDSGQSGPFKEQSHLPNGASDVSTELCNSYPAKQSFFFKLLASPVSLSLADSFFEEVEALSLVVFCSSEPKAKEVLIDIMDLSIKSSFLLNDFILLSVNSHKAHISLKNLTLEEIQAKNSVKKADSDLPGCLVSLNMKDSDKVTSIFSNIHLKSVQAKSNIFGVFASTDLPNVSQKVTFNEFLAENIESITNSAVLSSF